MVPVKQIPSNGHTDEDLVRSYQATGEQSELAVLYTRYTELVMGVCLKYLKDREQAKDAVMNIYQELVNKLQAHAVTNFKSWLYSVVKNHCLMELRKQKRTRVVELPSELMQQEDFTRLDDILDKEKEFQKLHGCIAALNTEQRRAIELFYLEGKCYNEIVETTGLEWNKVRSLVQNGRRNLKICMDK